MISRSYLFVRAVLGGVLALFVGVAIALAFPDFSVMDLKLFWAFVLYIAELIVVHSILWLFFKVVMGKREPFLHKNIIIFDGWGAVAFVFVAGVLFNDSYDLLFLAIFSAIWAFLTILLNALAEQEKENQQKSHAQKTKSKAKMPKERSNNTHRPHSKKKRK